jgi:uncharacterized membrane protein
MSLKQYQKVKIIITIILSIIVSQSMVYKNYLLPITAVITASLVLMRLRSKVKEIIADERDYATGGKSALLAIQIYSWAATIGMFVLYAFRDLNPAYEPIGVTLAFSACILMLIYAVVFRYYNNFSLTNKKNTYTIFALVLFVIVAIVSIRFFSGEDDWMCKNGQWVKHGNPSFDAPKTICK